jgi:hypothetical protein
MSDACRHAITAKISRRGCGEPRRRELFASTRIKWRRWTTAHSSSCSSRIARSIGSPIVPSEGVEHIGPAVDLSSTAPRVVLSSWGGWSSGGSRSSKEVLAGVLGERPPAQPGPRRRSGTFRSCVSARRAIRLRKDGPNDSSNR